ncbi:hypothetical protein DH2020_037933 [Rehmannia glutinosa]|uniref:monodehydroascorbate reductase (NADH) n=1 Tax=Rehmannia glutinosa TaxID=99300 RepID=A0ABR0V1A1_REHGL
MALPGFYYGQQMGRAFVYVIIGGGVAAGYAAHEFVKRGVAHGELCIISEEPVAPYERPALSKGYLLPEGIELILGTRVKSADVRRKTLLTATGETISYKYLIVATGARALKLEEFGVNGLDAPNVCYLRDLADADRLVDVMQSCSGGNAVVIGGGYIGMECAASLVINKLNATMVFPEAQCSKSLLLIFEMGANFLLTWLWWVLEFVQTQVYSRPINHGEGGIKVNGKMQSSNTSVYAIGDVAAFPVKIVGETRRLEHVDSARKSARHAVAAIMEPEKTGEFDYLPFFYSRVFTLSWQFYGDNAGEVVHFGDFSGHTFGAYWINKGHLVGSFLEGGTKEQYEAIAQTTRLKPKIEDLAELERQGLGFALSVSQKPVSSRPTDVAGSSIVLEKPLYAWHAAAGVIVAASIAAFAYWYGRRRRRW